MSGAKACVLKEGECRASVTEGGRERTMRCFDISSRRLRKVRDDDEPGRLTALSLYDY